MRILIPLLLLVVAADPALAKVGTDNTPEVIEGQYIVSTPVGAAEFRENLEGSEFTYVEELPFGLHLVQEDQWTSSSKERLRELGAREIQPNFVKRIASARAGGPVDQWALDNPETGADIGAIDAWDDLKSNPGSQKKVRVGIIDTGIDLKAAEFAGRIDFAKSYNFIGSNTNIQDYNGHGSHVAGIIGASHASDARIWGVNPNVEFVILKAFTMYGFATSGSVLKALDAALKANVKVVNASYGSQSYDKAEFEALDRLRKAGVLFVAAAGNQSQDTDEKPYYPAGYDLSNIVSVGASTRTDQPASFSNHGKTTVDVFAPGVDIKSTVVNVRYTNRRQVFSLAMNDTSAREWSSSESIGAGLTADEPWTFVSCGDKAGSCLRFRPPSRYSPSAKYDFFNLRYTKPTVRSDREKRYLVVTSTKYDFPRIDWQHEVTGSILAGGSSSWMLPANYTRGRSNGWITSEADISKPGLFYAGTTAWDQIILGFSTNFSKMAGHSDYRKTESMIDRFTIVNEDPVASSAVELYDGTSMAAPHVAGIATWLFAVRPTLEPHALKAKLIETCAKVTAMSEKSACGGRVRLDEALRRL